MLKRTFQELGKDGKDVDLHAANVAINCNM